MCARPKPMSPAPREPPIILPVAVAITPNPVTVQLVVVPFLNIPAKSSMVVLHLRLYDAFAVRYYAVNQVPGTGLTKPE